MEPNPILWLELRQFGRSGLFLILLFGALFEFISANVTGRCGCSLIVNEHGEFSIGLFGLILSLYWGWKFASQRLNEDMVMFTPLSPSQILNGKIMFGVICSVILYSVLLLTGSIAAISGDFEGSIFVLSAFLLVQYKMIIVLGFAAGAKSVSHLLKLFSLLSVFALAMIVLEIAFRHAFLDYSSLYHVRAADRPYWGEIGIAHSIGILSAMAAYLVGIAGLSTRLETRVKIIRVFAVLFPASIGIGALVLLPQIKVDEYASALTFIALLAVLYFIPLLAAVCMHGFMRWSDLNPDDGDVLRGY